MIAASVIPSSSAGPESNGPSRTATRGTTPEQRARACATRPQPSNAATPAPRSGLEEERDATKGNRRCQGQLRGAGQRRGAFPAECPVPLGVLDFGGHHRPLAGVNGPDAQAHRVLSQAAVRAWVPAGRDGYRPALEPARRSLE